MLARLAKSHVRKELEDRDRRVLFNIEWASSNAASTRWLVASQNRNIPFPIPHKRRPDDPWYRIQTERIAALAALHGVIASYERRSFVLAGGLMSYGTDPAEGERLVGLYMAQALRFAHHLRLEFGMAEPLPGSARHAEHFKEVIRGRAL